MRDRLSPRLQGLAALVVATAFGGASAAALVHAKKGDVHKPPVHYIHCAMEADIGPCGLDPAMKRPGAPPDRVEPVPRLDQPDFWPSR